MNGYLLIWILLQKIEKLEEELNTYKKNNTGKNWFVSSGQFPTCPVFFSIKKDMRFLLHISHMSLLWIAISLKLLLV